VIFNFDKLLDKNSPQFSARQGSLVNFRIPSIKSYKKIDEYTVEFITHKPDSFVPYQLCYILMASPAQWEKTGKDWNTFAKTPSGTGPWKLETIVPREKAEFVPFKGHWDANRVPKLEKVITIPIPDPNARTAALLSGQVDWIEAPAPDSNAAVLALGSGMGIVITFSSFGTLFASQWPLNGTNSAFSRGTMVSSFHGPVPDGVFAKVFQSFPVFSHWAGLAINI
jgi:ABC-type transport system substrate-binding protein